MRKMNFKNLSLILILIGVLILFNNNALSAQISVKTSDSTIVKNGDTITPIGFQGIHLISSPEYRLISIINSGKSVIINNIFINGNPDFSINSADSGLNLWEKKPLKINNITVDSGKSVDFQLNFCPLSGGDRSAVITITYDTSKSFNFTIRGRGRPEEIKEFTNSSQIMHKIWGGFNKNQDERPAGMVVDSAGNIYYSGNGKFLSSDTSYYDIFLGKVTADGKLDWQMIYYSKYNDRFTDPSQNDESGGSANTICMDDYGYIYIAGSVGNGSNSSYLTMVMKIDPKDGSQVWKKYWFPDTDRLKYTDSAVAYAIDVSDGLVFITGQGSDYAKSIQGIYITALSANDGNHKWSKIINPNNNTYNDRGYAVKADKSGSLIIAGWQGENTGSPFLCKLSNIKSKPSLEWAINFNMGTGSNFNAIDIDSNGNIYLSADRRGAATFFSIVKVSSDGKQIIAKTFPGTSGGNNNTKVVKVIGDSLFTGGRIGISGLDTNQGDGILLKLKSSDLSLQWAGVYYTGVGALEVCEHHIKGIDLINNELYLYGEVYTGNNNYFRYFGYWFNLPQAIEDYKPEYIDVTSKTVFSDLNKAGLVDGSTNGGVYEKISTSANIEFQNAVDKNEKTHGSQVDSDIFFMKLKLK